MTKFGKILVVANFFFSLVVACWSLAFFYTRIDWTENNPDSPAPLDSYISKKKTERGESGPVTPLDREEAYKDPLVGRMVGRKAHYEAMVAQARPADIAWRDARFKVADRERFRSGDRAFYRNEIAFINNAPAEKQLQEVVFGPDEQIVLVADANNPSHFLPQMKPALDRLGQPLRSLTFYEQASQVKVAALAKLTKDLNDAVNQDGYLTAELTGGKGPNGLQIDKGLTKRIEDERLKGADVLEEYETVNRLRNQVYGDSKAILDRRQQLEKRIKELEAVPVTKAQ